MPTPTTTTVLACISVKLTLLRAKYSGVAILVTYRSGGLLTASLHSATMCETGGGMSERRRTQAGQLVEDLMNSPSSPEETARRYPRAPKLRLRADTPAVDIDETTSATSVVKQLQGERLDTAVIRETGAQAVAVLLPVERYLELVGNELARRHHDLIVGPHGDFRPQDSALAELHVEQIDPNEKWPQGKR